MNVCSGVVAVVIVVIAIAIITIIPLRISTNETIKYCVAYRLGSTINWMQIVTKINSFIIKINSNNNNNNNYNSKLQ